MKLADIVERLADLVEIEVIIDECGNVAGEYTDRDRINAGKHRTCRKIRQVYMI